MKSVYDELVERYELLSDMDGFTDDVRQIGYAYKRNCETHYMVRLNTLPGMRFFIKRDFRVDGGWVIFSGMAKTARGISFFNPAGSAEKMSSGYLKLKFSELNLICYLRLSPKDFHFNTKAS